MRLLLANASDSILRAVTEILQRHRYVVQAVSDGQEALDELCMGEYDGAILDMDLPKLDGVSVLQGLRAQGVSVPVMMLTARANVADKVRGLDAGANDYITEPFDEEELLARLRAMLRTLCDTAENCLRFGNVMLNRKTYELSCGGSALKLSNREYQLMEVMMTAPHQYFSTERLFERVWGLDSNADTSVVWVYICYLRRKLKTLGARVKIRVTRCIGYSLEEV